MANVSKVLVSRKQVIDLMNSKNLSVDDLLTAIGELHNAPKPTDKSHACELNSSKLLNEKKAQCKPTKQETVSRSTIGNIMGNPVWNTYRDHAILIAKALGVTVADISPRGSLLHLELLFDNNGDIGEFLVTLERELANRATIITCRRGSIFVTCQVNPDGAHTLLPALRTGEFDKLNLVFAKFSHFKDSVEVTTGTVKRYVIPPKDFTPKCKLLRDDNKLPLLAVCGLARWEVGHPDVDQAYEEAMALLPNFTDNPHKCVIYLTAFPSERLGETVVYCQSNFLVEGGPPIKLILTTPPSLLDVARLVLYADKCISEENNLAIYDTTKLTAAEENNTAELHKSVFRYVINRKLVPTEESGDVEFSGATRWMLCAPETWLW
jgi:hypothetical protein